MPLSELNNSPSAASANSMNAEVFSSPAQVKSLSVTEMEAMAKKLRRHIITMKGKAGSGPPGGALSAVDILTALYFRLLRHRPSDNQ